MEGAVPPQIQLLFSEYPTLCGFSVLDRPDVSGRTLRLECEEEVFLGDVCVSAMLSTDQSIEIVQSILTTLSDLLSEEPEASRRLCGRTFARALH